MCLLGLDQCVEDGKRESEIAPFALELGDDLLLLTDVLLAFEKMAFGYKRESGRSCLRSGSKRARRRGPHQTSTGSFATAAEPSCRASSALLQSISCAFSVLPQSSSVER